jgi:hypothetical protein
MYNFWEKMTYDSIGKDVIHSLESVSLSVSPLLITFSRNKWFLQNNVV